MFSIIGGLIGAYQPIVADTLAEAQFAEINAIVAVLLWLMILPMLIQIDFASLKEGYHFINTSKIYVV